MRLGDERVITDVDVVSKVGSFAAYDEYTEFTLKDNIVYFKGKQCNNAYNSATKEIRVFFEKGRADLPKVEGIVLYEGGLYETDF